MAVLSGGKSTQLLVAILIGLSAVCTAIDVGSEEQNRTSGVIEMVDDGDCIEDPDGCFVACATK